jgi:ankyrin repeat protein
MMAVSDGDLEQVQKAIGSRSNPNRYDWELGYSPLGMAIERGHIDIVNYLLAMGANPYAGSISTNSLGLAAQCGETEIVQLLLKTGIDVNLPVNSDGWTALMCAVQSGDLSLVQTLVAAGANPNIWVGNETPILLAAKVADREIYNYLYHLVAPDLCRCADRDGEDTLQANLKRRVREQNRPIEKLIAVAAAGNVPEVQRAIELEVDIDAIGSQGHTALMAAAYYGHIAVIDTLLEAGANPNILSDGDEGWGAGMTALMLAAHSFFAPNRHEVVKLLVAGGAEIDRQGAGGKTALMYAALAGSGYRECVRSLIQAGADLNLRDDEGNTALMLVAATGNRELCNLLVQAGASTAGMESLDLIAASSKGDLDRVKQLLAQGGIRVNFDRGAALNNAASEGHTEVVKLLLSAGANVNLASRSGFTPLASAAYAGYGNIVRLLIQAGADPHLRTGNHRAYSPLEYAQMGLYNHSTPDRQHAEIIRLLEQLGAK